MVIASITFFGMAPAHGSGCYMVGAFGQKIEMSFCGVTYERSNTPSSNSSQPIRSERSQVEEISTNLNGDRVTKDKWNELKAFVAQQKDGIPVTLADVQGIMGFDGELTKVQVNGSEQWEWKDNSNPNIKVVGIFAEGKMTSLKGTVY